MGKEKILIIDDDDLLRYNLSLFLEDEGFECTQASNSIDALKLLDKELFAVAIVDFRLPGMSGGEFIPLASKKDSNIKFIIYTGSTDFCLTIDLISCGLRSENIFLKPVSDMNQFVIKIKELLRDNNEKVI